jgi:DNA-binding transcriptional LysR family regulator
MAMDVHLRDLRYFVAVAEELSFTRAAERLYLSQPALSKQIRSLEHAFGARLLERDKRHVSLTAAGEALLASCGPLLSQWDDVAAAVADAAAADGRLLRVGTLTSLGRSLYPGVIDRFSARQPGWRVELRSFPWSDPTAGLRDRTTDVAFVWLPVDMTGLRHEILVSERRFVAMSTRHALSRRSSVSFREIAAEPLAALPLAAGPLRDFWLASDSRDSVPAAVAAEVGSADETFEVVSSGAAMVLLAEGNALVYARPGIVCIRVEDLSPARLAVAWRQDDRRLAVAAFVQACLDAVGELHSDEEKVRASAPARP